MGYHVFAAISYEQLPGSMVTRPVVVHMQAFGRKDAGSWAAFFRALQGPPEGIVTDMQAPRQTDDPGLLTLGKFVLTRATSETAHWSRAGRQLTLHVNLSAKQLIDPTLYLVVSSALTDAGVEPGRLCLEVTETAILEDPQLARRHLEELRGLGVHLALDDFGVGYSSLSHVADLAPIDRVKIDRSFVSRICEQREGAIVASVVSLCQELGLDTVAEGVETSAQRAELQAMGVRRAQGFLFARPAPPEVIEAALGLVASG